MARTKKVRLALLGTGKMAATHAAQFKAIAGVELVAALDVDRQRVEAFAAQFGIKRAFTDLDRLLKDGECEAVSIVAPDAAHMPLSLECLKAGKHVLCEKPLALNKKDALKMVAAAKSAGVVNLVNLSYRNWSALQGAAQRVQRGDIGEVRHVEASYLQSWLSSKVWGDWRTTPAWLWRLSTRHGSHGVLGDVGVHIVDFATYPAGPIASVYSQLKAFHKAPGDRVGEYVLDANDSATLCVEFKNGALGTLHTSRWASGHANRLFLKVYGTKGAIDIDSERSTTAYRICCGKDLDKAAWREVEVAPTPSVYQRFIRAIRTGRPEQPDFARGSEVQGVLDACIRSNKSRRPEKV